MIRRDFYDEFDREISVAIYYAENGNDSVYASIDRDGGRLGEFLLINGRVYACRGWDDLDQNYVELFRVNPYDKVTQVLVGDPAALLYLERFAELLGKIRGEVTVGRRRSR
jgi:hypothetical protein